MVCSQFHRPVLDGTYACPECLEDIEVDAEGRAIDAFPGNGGATWWHFECLMLHVVGHQVGICSYCDPRPEGETPRQTARLRLERWSKLRP